MKVYVVLKEGCRPYQIRIFKKEKTAKAKVKSLNIYNDKNSWRYVDMELIK